MEFIRYEKCSTCKKALDFLKNKTKDFKIREIKEDTPTKEEINNWIIKYNLNVNKLFNTSGLVYRELNLKDKIKDISYDDKLSLLSSNGMLIKRPLLITDDKMLIGFKLKEWEDYFNSK